MDRGMHKHFAKTVKINTVLHRTKDTVPSWEEDFMANHFRQNAAHRPYVH